MKWQDKWFDDIGRGKHSEANRLITKFTKHRKARNKIAKESRRRNRG